MANATRRGTALWRTSTLLLLCAIACLATALAARGEAIDREYTLKAVYLYKFATYVEWPERAFRDSSSPFVIGILGPDPVGSDLRKIAEVKRIAGRKIEIRNYDQPEQVRFCQILFLPRALDEETRQKALALLARRNILLVGEDSEFLEQGGVIGLVVEDNRIRVHISQPGYQREELTVSAQLLRIANVEK